MVKNLLIKNYNALVWDTVESLNFVGANFRVQVRGDVIPCILLNLQRKYDFITPIY